MLGKGRFNFVKLMAHPLKHLESEIQTERRDHNRKEKERWDKEQACKH